MASRMSLYFVLYFVTGDVFLASLGMYLASNLLSQLTITDHLIFIAPVEVATWDFHGRCKNCLVLFNYGQRDKRRILTPRLYSQC